MTMWTFQSLFGASPDELEIAMRQSAAPELEGLLGWEFRGINLLPLISRAFMAANGNLRFIKVFYRSSKDGDDATASSRARGYNLKVRGSGRYQPWLGFPSDEAPKQHGFFNVFAASAQRRENLFPRALMLDYDLPSNTLFSGRMLVDYLVQPDESDQDLLLGKAYLHLGPVHLPSFFVLERFRKGRLAHD